MRSVYLALSLLLAPGSVAAGTDVYGHVGVALGGERLVTIEFEDGTTEDLRAGSGFAANLGFVHRFADAPFALQASVGYFSHETSAINSRARFSRYPLELLGFWTNGAHRFGGGLVHHMSPSLNLDNLGGSVELDAATGLAVEYGYSFFSIRYTVMDYSVVGEDIDGDSFGAYFSLGY